MEIELLKEYVDEILDIYQDNFKKERKENYFKEILNNDKYSIYIIKDIIIKGYMIILDSIDIDEIYEIAIHKDYQHQGLATKLIEYYPKNKDIFLEVSEYNYNAIALYKKLGFKEINIRKNYYGKNDNAIIMKKNYFAKN